MGTVKNEESYKKAIEDYSNDHNLTMKYLSQQYGFDRACFSRWLKKNNIEFEKKGISYELSQKYEKAKEEYVNTDITLKVICDKYNIGKKNFSLYLKSNDVEVRGGFENKSYTYNDDYFSVIDTEDKAYWLGFIYADGCVVHNEADRTYRLTIELSNVDIEHLEKFKQCINANCPIAHRKNREISSITINSKKITEDLIKYGCIPNKTEDGTISAEIMELPYELKYAFIRGFLDGDGYIDKKRTRVIFTIKSEAILNAFKILLKDYDYKVIDDITYYRIAIYKKDVFRKFLSNTYMYTNMYLQRKYDICIKWLHAPLSGNCEMNSAE